MIPTVNDNHIVKIAGKIKELGVYIQNIMPLIPLFKLAHLSAPSPTDRKMLQDECAKTIKQMTHCRQCRADAIGLLGKDMSTRLFG